MDNKYWIYKKNRKKIDIKLLNEKDNNKKQTKIAIIISYRNRVENLNNFIEYFYKLNNNNNIDIFIVEQNNADNFNRGLLLNIGFIISNNKFHYDRYIFHDVDMYPEQNLFDLYFQFIDYNIHYASPDLNSKYKFNEFLGGVIGMNENDIKKINGFPNNFFGWGGEDDALYNRLATNNIKIYRPKNGNFEIPFHDIPKKIEINEKKKENILNDLNNWNNNGINQLLKIYINVKEYSDLFNFLKSSENNINNNAISLEDFLKKNKNIKKENINYYFYKIDYLAKHNKFNDIFENKNIIQQNINKNLEEFKKNKLPIFQHKKNPKYISVIEPLVYWDEIENKIIDSYTEPKKYILPNLDKINKRHEKINNLVKNQFEPYNKQLTKEDLKNTIKFIFDVYHELIYFRIRDNKIVLAYHLYNSESKIDWYKYLKYISKDNQIKNIDNSLINIMNDKNQNYETLLKPHFIHANHCLLNFEAFTYYEGMPYSYILTFIEMLNYTINTFGNVPDCDLLINRKDFAYLRKDNKYAYDHLLDEKIVNPIKKYWPLGVQSKKDINLDITIPSADEWTDLQKMKKIKFFDWKNKISKAVYRGQSSGCGSNTKNNPRLKLAELSYNNKNNILDVAISKLTYRIKVYNQFVSFIDRYKYKHLIGSKMDALEQSKYKYIFNIEGNAQAYRYPNEFKKKSLILNVKSDYYMWFEPLLKNNKHMIIINKNYDNLFDVLDYLKKNDDKAKKIASNGYKFSKKYITKDNTATYWLYYMFYSNQFSI